MNANDMTATQVAEERERKERTRYGQLVKAGRVEFVPNLPTIDTMLWRARDLSIERMMAHGSGFDVGGGAQHRTVEALCGGMACGEMRMWAIDWLARQGWCARDVLGHGHALSGRHDPFDWIEVRDGNVAVRIVDMGPDARSCWMIDMLDFGDTIMSPACHWAWVVREVAT